MHRHADFFLPIAAILALSLTTAAFAVKPSEWVHRTEADFSEGERQGLVVTNLGEVRLAQDTHLIASLSGEDALIYDIAQLDDGRVFLALGPEGRLAELVDESIETIEEFDGAQIFSLTTDGEDLWVGVSGNNSRLERRQGEEMAVRQTVELDDARYVWDIVLANDRVYAATGADGRLYAIDLGEGEDDPVITTALDAQPSNILTLAADADGRIYAGTDGQGLVYRLERNGNGAYEPFVLYDAPEPEIGALLVLDDGTVYAGTADADQARPGRLEAARDETTGRPDALAPADPGAEPDGEVPDAPPVEDPQPEPQDDADAEPLPDADADADAAEEAADDLLDEAEGPTPEQYEALRQIVSERLTEARESGRVPAQTGPEPSARPAQSTSRPTAASPSRSGGGSGSRRGNAIYRIAPDGFVHEVFRESVMILNLLEQDGALIVTTGNEGQIYRVDPANEEVAILADLDPQQIPAVFKTADGDVLFGTANPGLLFELRGGFTEEGTLTSQPLDADQISLWGKLHVKAANHEGAAIEVRTRSGNVSDPELGTWSNWSDPQVIELEGGRSSYLDVEAPSARFLQYQLTLRAANGHSPTVYQMSLRYLMPNLPPRITSLTSEYEGSGSGRSSRRSNPNEAPEAQTTLKIEWDAEDPNDDRLVYTVEAKPFGGDAPFVTIAEDVTDTDYEWDTRTMPDGRYVLRVTASDEPDNIPDHVMTATRRSDPVTIDNTPPDIDDFDLEINDDGGATLTARVTDELSPIREVRYRLSGESNWRLILPEDLIYDSTEETFRVTIPDLASGDRVLSLRATDAQGNTRHVSRTFNIGR